MRKNEQLTGSEGSNYVCVETTNHVIILERRYHLPPLTIKNIKKIIFLIFDWSPVLLLEGLVFCSVIEENESNQRGEETDHKTL